MSDVGGYLAISAVAYIGPGAGFAAAGSLAVWLMAGLLAVITLAYLPLRIVFGTFTRRRRKRRGGAKQTRVILIGLDGLDPGQSG